MTDIPIIFSAPMVRALLDGRKTMTRRLAWRTRVDRMPQASPWQKVRPGDRLWVREAHSPHLCDDGVWYWADGNVADQDSMKPKPSIHMFREHSRLTLTVTATKIERLKNINGIEALAEGIPPQEGVAPWRVFMRLWNELHGEGAWQLDPEVVALTFSVAGRNIDAEPKAA